MTWCPPFMVRPPEDSRPKRDKKGDDVPSPSEVMKSVWQSTKLSIASAGQSTFQLLKKKVETGTMSMEERMQDARTSRLTEERASELLSDPNPLIRLELAFNDTISGEILEQLKHDPDVTVSTVARRRLMLLE